MSISRFGKAWADVDEDEDEQQDGSPKSVTKVAGFETKADEQGIKLVIDYVERAGKTYKVTRKVRQTILHKRTSAATEGRKSLEKFGKALTNDPKEEALHVKQSEEEVNIELTKKTVTLAAKDDAEDKFLEDAITATQSMFKEKKSWAAANKDTQATRYFAGDDRPTESVAIQINANTTAPDGKAAPPPGGKGGVATYVPPGMRGRDGKGKSDGKFDQQQDASLRITNLSEDAKEGDLQMLFGKYGRLARVYIAKDQFTGLSRGFAFVTYYNRRDAQQAMDCLHGHGYDNLIMQVLWAKPRL